MKNKDRSKSQIKLVIIALALLLCFALSVVLATAFYKANRQAIGYVNMDKGLFFEVENMKSADNDTLLYFKDKDVSVAPIELTTSGVPNEQFYIANPTITPLEGTVPYAVRGYLEYIFYDNTGAEKTVDELGGDLNAILNKLFVLDSLNSPISFGENWLHDSRTNYYYSVDSMTAGQVTTNIKAHSFEEGGTSTGTTKVFAEQTVSGEAVSFLTLADWPGEYGGPIINGIEIGKFTIELNLEVLQYNEMALMSEWDMSKTYYDDQGNVSEIQGDQITLEDGAEIGNGADSITFESDTLEALLPESGGSVSLNASSFSDKVNLEEVTLSGDPVSKTTVYIGSKAFYGCTKLKMNLTEHENIEYVIASDAFSAGATIKHGTTDITGLVIDPSTAGKTAGVDNKWQVASNVYLFLPNTTLTPSTNVSYGDYEYTDDQGTWYFDLLDSSGNKVTLNQAQSGGVSTLGASTLATSTDYVARINRCDNLTTVNDYIIPALIGTTELDGMLFNVESIGYQESYMARNIFWNQYIVNSVTISYGIVNIGGAVFRGLDNLRSVNIPNSVISINDDAFNSCTSLINITIPNSVTAIGWAAFGHCTSLTTIHIPDSVTTIWHSFDGCTSLDKFITSGNGTYTAASNGDLLIKGTEIVALAPYNLTSVTIPDGVTNFMVDFSVCTSLDKFITSGNGTYTAASNGDLLIKGTEIVAFAPYNLTEVVIPNNVTSIGNAFQGSSITKIAIGNGVTSIGSSAFASCSSLSIINIPDSVISIGDAAFQNCTSLGSINIPDSVTSIGDWAFYNCISLTSITIPDGVTAIGAFLFQDCSSIVSIIIRDGVTSIGDAAFRYCSSLTSITIPDSVTSIGSYAFESGTSLKDVTIGNGVTSIPSYCFSGCTALEAVTVGSRVTSIEDGAFYNCTNLTTFNWVIEYDLVGVNATNVNQTITSSSASLNETVVLDAPTNIESGVSFLGWSDGTTTYQPGDSYTFTLGNRKLTAVWSVAKVSFDANGGEGTIETIVGDKSVGVTLPDGSALSRTGYTFLGWSTNNNATTAEYIVGSVVYESMTLYAVWAEGVTITLNANGGVGEEQVIPALNSSYFYLSNYNSLFTREGYTLIGWALESGATTAKFATSWSGYPSELNNGEDVTLYAIWKDNSVGMATFNANGGVGEDFSITFTKGTSINLADYANTFTYEGYTLIGWTYYDGMHSPSTVSKDAVIETIINGEYLDNIRFEARWAKSSFTFTLVSSGANEGDQVVTLNRGETLNLGNYTFTKEGFVLLGWTTYSGSTTIIFNTTWSGLAENVGYETLYAVWQKEYITFTFYGNGGLTSGGDSQITATLRYDAYLNFNDYSSAFIKDGYVVSGWATYPEATSYTYTATASMQASGVGYTTFYAVWRSSQITITFDMNGGVGENITVTGNFATSADVLFPTADGMYREGYKFINWSDSPGLNTMVYVSPGQYGSSLNITFTGDYTFYAGWLGQKTVSFDINGGTGTTPSDMTVYYDYNGSWATDYITFPTADGFSKDGYVFAGWSTSSTSTWAEIQAGENSNYYEATTYYAVWKEAINATFDMNGGEQENISAYLPQDSWVYISKYVSTPTRFGYYFLGWSTDPNATSATYSETAQIYPQNVNGGADFTLYAVWEKGIIITLNANGGVGEEEKVVIRQNRSLDLSSYQTIFTCEGYTLLGWSTNSSATSAEYSTASSYNPSSDSTLYAIWAESITITFNSNGGNEADVITEAAKGQYFGLNITFTREGYTHLGWSTDPNATNVMYSAQASGFYPENINGGADFTLYAVWEKVVKVTFDVNGGSGENRTYSWNGANSYYLGIYVSQPTRSEEWVFLGWSTSPTATSASYTQSSSIIPNNLNGGNDVTLYAVWQKAIIKVTFDMNGGNEENVSFDWKSTDTFNISNYVTQPTRGEYWTFLGWSTSPTATGASYTQSSSITPIYLNGGNDATLYAVWQNEKYVEINFYPNGGVGEVVTVEAEKGQYFYLKDYTNIFTREGYQIVGWATSETATSYGYSLTSSIWPSSNYNLYAFWKAESELVRVEFDLSEVEGQSNYVVYGEVDRSINGPSVTTFRNAQGQAIYGWARTPGMVNDYHYEAKYSIYLSNSYFTAGQTTVLYPVWTNVYTVHFDANGGTGTVPADIETWRNQQPNIGDFELTKDGYTFAGWDKDPNFSYGWTDISKGSSSFSFYEESDTTYYAIWAAPVTLTFDANGGEGTVPETMTVNYMESMTIPTGEGLTKAGFKLVGWARKANADYDNCDLRVSNGTQTVVFVSGNYTLYAVWEKLNNEIYFGSLQGSQIEAAQGIWAGKTELTSEEQNEIRNIGYNDNSMSAFMPRVYLAGAQISEDWDNSNYTYGVRGYAAKITSDTFTVVFPNALPTGWKLLNYRFEEIDSGDVTVVDGKAQVEFTHTYMEEATESDKMIFLFTLPSQPAEDVSTQGMIITYPENLWDAVLSGTEFSDAAAYYAMSGFTVEIYNADTNAMLWLSTMSESGVSYNFVSGNYKIVISSENVVGVFVANIEDMSELNILENLTYSSANGQTIITFSYTYSEDNPGFGMVVKTASEPLTDAIAIYGMDGAIASAFADNIMPLVYKAAFAHMGFTCIGTTLTDEEINYAGYIAGLLMEELIPEDVAFGATILSGMEIWSENGEIYENPGEYIALAKGKTYTIKSKEYLQSLAMFDFGAGEYYNLEFTYNEETGVYEATLTVSENAGSEMNMCFGGEDFDFSTVEGLPEYDENTDYTENLEALFNG